MAGSSAKTYPLAGEAWPAAGEVVLSSVDGARIAVLPLEFMQRGHVCHWDYIFRVIQDCIIEPGSVQTLSGSPVDTASAVNAGPYTFIRLGKCM